MDKRDLLVEKVKNEYESYIEKLKQCSFDEVIENAEQISLMKLVKDYILNGYVAHGDEVEFLVELNNPLKAICDGFEASDEAVMDTLQQAIDEAKYYKENVVQVPDYIQKLAEKILKGLNIDTTEFMGDNGEFKNSELTGLVLEMANMLKREDAKFLMQFKNPLEVMEDYIPYEKLEKNRMDDALEKMRNADIYSMPYPLDEDGILPEAKFRHNAINDINNIVPLPDFNTTGNWLSLCRELYLEDAESDEINPYSNFVDAIYHISEKYGAEMLQKLYDLGEDKCVLPSELKGAAEYLENGGSIDKVPYLVQTGSFEEISSGNNADISDSEDEEFEM